MCDNHENPNFKVPSSFTIKKMPDPKYGEGYILILDSEALPGPIALTSGMTLAQVLNIIEDTATAYQGGLLHTLDSDLSHMLSEDPKD